MFANLSSIDKKLGESYKNSVVPKMWGTERLKVEKSVRKWSQNALFANFPLKFYNRGKFLVEKYVIKGLASI